MTNTVAIERFHRAVLNRKWQAGELTLSGSLALARTAACNGQVWARLV